MTRWLAGKTEAELAALSAKNRAARAPRPAKDIMGKGPHGPVGAAFMNHYYGGGGYVTKKDQEALNAKPSESASSKLWREYLHQTPITRGKPEDAMTWTDKPKRKAAKAKIPTASKGEAELAQQLRAIQLYGWQCEYRFDPKRRWRLDFAWPDSKIAVEVEGGIWTDGRHTRGVGFEMDCVKYANLAIAGWRLIRCTPGQIKSGMALDWIQQALITKRPIKG